MIRSRIAAILLAGALAFSLAACGSSETAEEPSETEHTFESETPSASESEASEEEESKLAPDGVWETDGERVTIEGDTVTIDYVDENGDVTETYWVGSFELNENSDTWTSTRDPDAEMTAQCETIDFAWEGTDNEYDTLSYVVTNEDGTKKTVKLERTESLGEVAEGVVPDFSGGEAAAVSGGASDSGNASAGSDTSSVQSSAEEKTSDGGTSAVSNMSADTKDSADEGSSSSAQTSGSAGSSAKSGNTGSAGSGSSSAASGSTGSSNSGSSSGNSGSSGTTVTACSHNYAGTTTKAATCTSGGTMTYTCTKCGDSYQTATPATGHSYNGGTVTKAATCFSAGTTTYTCTKCGDSYTTSIPATGNHNWQAVYRTESVKVQDAVYEGKYICNNCFNYYGDSKFEVQLHIESAHNGIGGYTTGKVCVQDAVYENQQVLDHYVCSACGAVK